MNRDEMLQEKGTLIKDMRALNDKAITAKAALNADDQAKYDAMEAILDRITAAIERDEKLNKADIENRRGTPAGVRAAVEQNGKPVRSNQGEEYCRSFRAYLRGGDRNTPMEITASLTKATGTQVGYLAPIEYETEIRKNVYPLNVMRRLASVQQSSSDSIIAMEGTLPAFSWIDELGSYPQTNLTVGRLNFGAYKLGGILKASEEILQDAFISLPEYIADRSKVSIAQSEEAAFTIGDGSLKPTGVAPSATVAATTASPTAFTMDEVLTFMDALAPGYLPGAQLLVSRAFRSALRKLKDSQNRYLWEPGLQVGVPDQFNGHTVNISAYLGNITATSIPALFGDFKYYQIMDRQGFYFRQLNELYAETGQVGFQINERVDGKLLNAAAVVSLVMHA